MKKEPKKKNLRENELNLLKNELNKNFIEYNRYNEQLIKYFQSITNKPYFYLEIRPTAPTVTLLLKIFDIDIADITHKWHTPSDYINIPDKFPILTVENFLMDHLKIFFSEDMVNGYKKLTDSSGNSFVFHGIYSKKFEDYFLKSTDQSSLNKLFVTLYTDFGTCKFNEVTKNTYYEKRDKFIFEAETNIFSKEFIEISRRQDYRVTRIKKTLKRISIIFSDFIIQPKNNLLPISIDNFTINFKNDFSSCLILSLVKKGNILVTTYNKTFCEENVVIGNSDATTPPLKLNVRYNNTSTFITQIDSLKTNYCLRYRGIKSLPHTYSDLDYICHWTMSSKMITNQCLNFYYSSLFGNKYDITLYNDNNDKQIYSLINNIQRIIYSSELLEDIIVYRTSRSQIYSKETSTYNLKIGDTYFQPFFVSTTIYKGATFLTNFTNFETGLGAFVIRIPKGSKVLYINNCSLYKEYEVLLPLGCSFKINAVDDNKYVKGKNNTYYKLKIYYANYVEPNKDIFGSSEVKWDFIFQYIRNKFLTTKELILPEPTQLTPVKNLSYCKNISEFFVKTFELCSKKINIVKKMIEENIHTFVDLLQLIEWFKTMFKNLLDMFNNARPIVWFYFKKSVVDFKDFVLIISIKLTRTIGGIGMNVFKCCFEGLEYVLTLLISDENKKKKLKIKNY